MLLYCAIEIVLYFLLYEKFMDNQLIFIVMYSFSFLSVEQKQLYMCKIRLQNCKIRHLNCLQPLKSFIFKSGAYCFSFTSSVDLNALHNSSNLNQKKFKILELIILKIKNYSLIIAYSLKTITQYFLYYRHGNTGNNDDVLSQNLQVT